MPEMDGMELLQEVKNTHPEIEVIMCTAYGSIDTAVEAMKIGAWHSPPNQSNGLLLKMLEKISIRQELALKISYYVLRSRKIQPD